ncbi:hypothetical protein [Desulfobacter sp.]|uniref:hypothetical protein n=1 Tax=Desulfobacter sp. TaxID=2294 RepID=UPI003D109A64
MDKGNRRISGIASKILGRVKPGDIILLHDSKPWAENPEEPDNTVLTSFLTELFMGISSFQNHHFQVQCLQWLWKKLEHRVSTIETLADYIRRAGT